MATVDFTRINTNIAALNSLNTLRDVNKNLAIAQTRLATGRRINEAADDPAGLTLSTKFDVRAQGLQVAMDNIGDAKNLLAVGEGGLNKINEILAKMRAKAEAAASDTLGSTERATIKQDLENFAKENPDHHLERPEADQQHHVVDLPHWRQLDRHHRLGVELRPQQRRPGHQLDRCQLGRPSCQLHG